MFNVRFNLLYHGRTILFLRKDNHFDVTSFSDYVVLDGKTLSECLSLYNEYINNHNIVILHDSLILLICYINVIHKDVLIYNGYSNVIMNSSRYFQQQLLNCPHAYYCGYVISLLYLLYTNLKRDNGEVIWCWDKITLNNYLTSNTRITYRLISDVMIFNNGFTLTYDLDDVIDSDEVIHNVSNITI